MYRLKELLSEKIERVQQAEISGAWGRATIEKEVEFLVLVKQLIASYETQSLESLPPAKPPEPPPVAYLLIHNYIVELMLKFLEENYVIIPYNLLIQYKTDSEVTAPLLETLLRRYEEQERKLGFKI